MARLIDIDWHTSRGFATLLAHKRADGRWVVVAWLGWLYVRFAPSLGVAVRWVRPLTD
jgi:hypothetical protein